MLAQGSWTGRLPSCSSQPLASLVDVVDAVGKMAEVAAAAVLFGIPVVRQLDFGEALLPRCGKEDEGEAPLLAVDPTDFVQTDEVEEADRRVGVSDADHGVQKFGHGLRKLVRLGGFPAGYQRL
jgi:hypothetical protein